MKNKFIVYLFYFISFITFIYMLHEIDIPIKKRIFTYDKMIITDENGNIRFKAITNEGNLKISAEQYYSLETPGYNMFDKYKCNNKAPIPFLLSLIPLTVALILNYKPPDSYSSGFST